MNRLRVVRYDDLPPYSETAYDDYRAERAQRLIDARRRRKLNYRALRTLIFGAFMLVFACGVYPSFLAAIPLAYVMYESLIGWWALLRVYEKRELRKEVRN